MSYSNISRNTSSYTNVTKTSNSITSYLLTEDGEFLTQEDTGLIKLEQASDFNNIFRKTATYTNLSKNE